MITPNDDKIAIKAILDTDPYLQRAGFTPDNIMLRRFDAKATSDRKLKIYIYMGQPENPRNFIQRGMVYRIVVVGPASSQGRVDSAVEQVTALFSEKDIGHGHILYILDPPLELESDAEVYSVETSFVSYVTVYTPIKK